MKLSNVVNSIDSALEKHKSYDNSMVDKFFDNLTQNIKIIGY